MNTTKPANPTHRQSWVNYVSSQLQRAVYFMDRDHPRAMNIENSLRDYVKKQGPSGSGIDTGTELDTTTSKPQRLVFMASFHHMDEHGGYDGWTHHKIIVTPTFGGFDVKVTGSNRNQIKDYLGDTFHRWLGEVADHPALIENN